VNIGDIWSLAGCSSSPWRADVSASGSVVLQPDFLGEPVHVYRPHDAHYKAKWLPTTTKLTINRLPPQPRTTGRRSCRRRLGLTELAWSLDDDAELHQPGPRSWRLVWSVAGVMLLIGAVVAVVIGLAGWGVRRLPRALDDPGAAAQYRGIHPRIVEPFSDYSC